MPHHNRGTATDRNARYPPVPIGQLPPLTHYSQDLPNNKSQRDALWRVVRQYTGHPQLMAWSARLIKEWDVPERDDRALARAIQQYSQRHIRFFRERPERFASPLRTLEWGFGDCDDKTILIATVLRSFRVPVRAKFMRMRVHKDGSSVKVAHVWPEVRIDGEWLALESVHPWQMGDSPQDHARRKHAGPIRIETVGD